MILVCCVLLFRYKHHTWASKTAALLVISGGIGNLIDRIAQGFVVDFLSFSIFPPVFNFADCCVTIGSIFFIFHIFLSERNASGLHEKSGEDGELLEEAEKNSKEGTDA